MTISKDGDFLLPSYPALQAGLCGHEWLCPLKWNGLQSAEEKTPVDLADLATSQPA